MPPIIRRAWSPLVVLLAVVVACSSSNRVVDSSDVASLGCDVSCDCPAPPDVAPVADAPKPDVVGRSDAQTADVPADIPANPCGDVVGDLPIGAGCTSHCECASGLCYDEVYLAPFRFCTKPCGGPSEGCGVDGACLIFDGVWAQPYGLTLTHFCMPRCSNLEDCQAIDPAYNLCTHPNMAKFDDHTVGAPSCQVTSE